ncbi:MAG: hypothetical protein QW794_03775 [Thermosphaera sp.]
MPGQRLWQAAQEIALGSAIIKASPLPKLHRRQASQAHLYPVVEVDPTSKGERWEQPP